MQVEATHDFDLIPGRVAGSRHGDRGHPAAGSPRVIWKFWNTRGLCEAQPVKWRGDDRPLVEGRPDLSMDLVRSCGHGRTDTLRHSPLRPGFPPVGCSPARLGLPLNVRPEPCSTVKLL